MPKQYDFVSVLNRIVKLPCYAQLADADGAIVPDLGGLADDDARAVVDEEALADRRGGMDLNARAAYQPLRHPAGEQGVPLLIQPMGTAMRAQRLIAVIQPPDLKIGLGGGVTFPNGGDVLAHLLKHSDSSYVELYQKQNTSATQKGDGGEISLTVPLRYTHRLQTEPSPLTRASAERYAAHHGAFPFGAGGCISPCRAPRSLAAKAISLCCAVRGYFSRPLLYILLYTNFSVCLLFFNFP